MRVHIFFYLENALICKIETGKRMFVESKKQVRNINVRIHQS